MTTYNSFKITPRNRIVQKATSYSNQVLPRIQKIIVDNQKRQMGLDLVILRVFLGLLVVIAARYLWDLVGLF